MYVIFRNQTMKDSTAVILFMQSCLEAFYAKNNVVPQRLIFYRDGVSEGEFEIVRREEMEKSLDGAFLFVLQTCRARRLIDSFQLQLPFEDSTKAKM